MKKLLLLTLTAFCLIQAKAQDWNEAIKAVASDREANDEFGWSVSISGNYAIVGAHLEDEDTSGANYLSWAGSAYIVERDGSGNWNQVQKITASDRGADDKFGYSVSISGNYAIVGAYY
ncbi:FG-GAP repeat protein, partial [Candidatus Amoebophilus asiaticus]|nr:FG-GAP repeat protein [Candidatus Amoebophilus asiaticus]